MKFPLLLALASALAGCASLPEIDPDLACHIPSPNEAAAVKVMKTENIGLTGTNFVAGNKVDLLQNGAATYQAMQSAIGSAKIRIDMESYEFDGAVAGQFAALLGLKAQLGVRVDLIYDAWGSKAAPSRLFARLRASGVHVVEYSPFDPTRLTSLDLNKRDHRKLLVIDGATVVTGGINIAQVYENRRQPFRQTADPRALPWRDTDVEITGPVAADFERLYLQTWAAQHGSALPPPPAAGPQAGGDEVQAIDGTPVARHPAIYRSLLTAIAAARHSVHLTTGFFAPTPDLAEALECAARRGVDVKLVLPSESNSDTTLTAGRSHYTQLLRAGVQIYERQGAVLHAKTAVIDGVWSVVGSANLDWRSVVFNNEIDAVVLGRHFGGQMEAMFAQDVLASKQITLTAWRRRGLAERLNEMRARAVEVLL